MATKQVQAKYTPRLKELYVTSVSKDLMKDLEIKNKHDVPKMTKIVINIGLGRSKDDKRMFEAATTTLRNITGQQPVKTYAKKSIASFKLREGNPIGLKVTLRGDRMYEFYDRLVTTVLPRVRDFHGVSSKAFDAQGNYSIGLNDQSVFPELSFEDTTTTHGLQINIITSVEDKEQSRALLSALGMPFEKERK